jgi:hypothetical protein
LQYRREGATGRTSVTLNLILTLTEFVGPVEKQWVGAIAFVLSTGLYRCGNASELSSG